MEKKPIKPLNEGNTKGNTKPNTTSTTQSPGPKKPPTPKK